MIFVQTDGSLAGDNLQRVLISFIPEQLSVPERIHPVEVLFLLNLQELFCDPVPFMLDQCFNFGHRCLQGRVDDQARIAGDDQGDGSAAGAEDPGDSD
jgi:hypothetical protein